MLRLPIAFALLLVPACETVEPSIDAFVTPDAGADAGADAGRDAALDGGSEDAGSSEDAGAADAPARDAGTDAPHDAGGPCDGPDLGSALGVGVAVGTTAGSGRTFVHPDCTETPSSAVVHRWTAPETGEVQFDTFGSAFDTVLALRDPGCRYLVCSDDTDRTMHGLIVRSVVAGEVLHVVVTGFDAESVGPYVLSITTPVAAETACEDGLDDDRDGLLDCEDDDCATAPRCVVELCRNGVDDDGDDLVDCIDPDCTAACEGARTCADLICVPEEVCIECSTGARCVAPGVVCR